MLLDGKAAPSYAHGISRPLGRWRCPMRVLIPSILRRRLASWLRLHQVRHVVTLFFLLVLFPALALAQSGSPFDTGFTALQTLFTGTVAKVASLIAIVIGGYQFAHGEPGAKRAGSRMSRCRARASRRESSPTIPPGCPRA